MSNYDRILARYYADKKWTIYGDGTDYTLIVWMDIVNPKPSQAELDALQAQLLLDEAAEITERQQALQLLIKVASTESLTTAEVREYLRITAKVILRKLKIAA